MRWIFLFLVAVTPTVIAKPVSEISILDDGGDTSASIVDNDHNPAVSEVNSEDSAQASEPPDVPNQQQPTTAKADITIEPDHSSNILQDPGLLSLDPTAQAREIHVQPACSSDGSTTVNKRELAAASDDLCLPDDDANTNPILMDLNTKKQCLKGTKTVCCKQAMLGKDGTYWVGVSCYKCILNSFLLALITLSSVTPLLSLIKKWLCKTVP